MKKILSILAITLTSSVAMASTGTINFTGTVSTGGTCPIDVVTPGTGTPLPLLNLGDFKKKDFTAIGQETPQIGFALRITPDATCTIPPGAVGNITFTPAYGQDGSGKLYALQNGLGYTNGLALKISDRTGGQLDPDTASMDYPLSETDPTEMIFSARLQTTAATVDEGQVATTITYVVAIN
ncbi:MULTISPECIES: fimbrial protein [Pseudomonas]|jgi:major type 1 subunit fimbrin (pilin)|uniref:fimbrial protein n=1 Tax=Pseudomonas TaxID=286 RepID=UPI0020931AA9|nr:MULTISPECIES: fimbrial protein [Pseudomonas]USS57417.1 fimbrial protein [Pseudomonas kermanshahensis]UVL68272.1 fimbrial protein [Pseudomonas sp. B21-031]